MGWARTAWSLVKPILPKTVTEKVFLFADSFENCTEIQTMLDPKIVMRLKDRDFPHSSHRRREGHVLIPPRGVFELPVDVPAGASIRWNFDVKSSQGRRPDCCVVPMRAKHDVTFSVRSMATAQQGSVS